MYRWYVPDPIVLAESIRWTIEHGHANNFANDYASVAYWYQGDRAEALPSLPDREALRPRLPEVYPEAREAAFMWMASHMDDLGAIEEVSRPFYEGRFTTALERARR